MEFSRLSRGYKLTSNYIFVTPVAALRNVVSKLKFAMGGLSHVRGDGRRAL